MLPHELRRYEEKAERTGKQVYEIQQEAKGKDWIFNDGYEFILVKRNKSTVAYVPIPKVRMEHLHAAMIEVLEGIEDVIGRDLEPYFWCAGADELDRMWRQRNG